MPEIRNSHVASSDPRKLFLSSTLPLAVFDGTSMLIQFTLSIFSLNVHPMSIGCNKLD